MKRGLISRIAIACMAAATAMTLSASPVSAANGDVLVNDWGNTVPYGGNCGTVFIEFYNASSAPVLSVDILYNTWYDDSRPNATKPYRSGSASRSWVTFRMYLKPGRTASFQKSLCTNVPYINTSDPGQSRSFKPMRIDWQWA